MKQKEATNEIVNKDFYLVKTPWWVKKLYPDCVWDMPEKNKTLYLSFDDGPHPTITPFVLKLLKQYNAKASFFCIGENVAQHPDLFKQYIDEGHAVGNHTYKHVNGWKTNDEDYLYDIERTDRLMSTNLFRPPYGRITRSQIKKIRNDNAGKKIIMWNILAGDWVTTLSPDKCYTRMREKISEGDIIVLHESNKSWERMSYCLPRLLKEFTAKGYVFAPIQ